ncbi:MAG: thioredoxin family protein [Chitinophagaceae bacterium]|nr:MAG: thioredoxin family protein [Chitinophagaceae bacterium]
MLINFSGSDWCIPCIQMQQEYFDNDAFKKMADSQLVIIRADFPRKKKNIPAKEILLQNEQLAEKFNVDGIFPLTLLLDGNQKVIRRWEGKPQENVADFIAAIITTINKKK